MAWTQGEAAKMSAARPAPKGRKTVPNTAAKRAQMLGKQRIGGSAKGLLTKRGKASQ